MADALIRHLLESTVCLGAAWILTLSLRKNGAHVRYWVWFAASLKFLVPFALLVRIGSLFEIHSTMLAPTPLPRMVAAYSREIVLVPAGVLDAGPTVSSISSGAFLAVLWLTGFLTIAFIWGRRFARMVAVRRGAAPIRTMLCPLPVFVSKELIEPGVFGIRKPVVLLPARVMTSLTAAQLAAVIAHEISHARRKDNLTAAIHMFVQATFWFHPLLWLVGARLVEERERACDEEIIRLGGLRRDYAEGILTVCKICIESPVLCIAGVSGSDLKARIQRIMRGTGARQLTAARRLAIACAAMTALVLPVAIGTLHISPLAAQTGNTNVPKFEVVSVKPCTVGENRMRDGGESSPGRLSIGCDLLADDNNLGILQRAYARFAGGHANPMGIIPISGGPKWIHADPYSIQATTNARPSLEMMQGPMLQALLEDRFKLKMRHEIKQGPVYNLTVIGGKSKLQPFADGSCVQMPMIQPLPQLPAGQRFCRSLVGIIPPHIETEGGTLLELTKLLNLVLDRPVIDKTGIGKRFTMRVDFARDAAVGKLPNFPPPPGAPAPPPDDPSRPNIFTAIQEQLGLKLTPATGPVEKLVIDHIERPTGN